MNNSDSEVKFVAGFILGMAAGLAIGLVFAPTSGGDTRELLKEKMTDAGEMIKELAGDVGGKVKEIAGDRKKIYTETWQHPRSKPYNEEL
jgi:gas vesicle protein